MTDKDGNPTTVEAALPSVLQGTQTTEESSSTKTSSSLTFSPTGGKATLLPSTEFPVCNDDNAAPFCLPTNNQVVYVGNTYYVTWNADKFAANSNITVKLNYDNSSEIQAFTTEPIDAAWGVTTIKMEKEWLQGYSMYNLTLLAFVYEGGATKANVYDGPKLQLQNAPPVHYPPPSHTKMPDRLSLLIGLPLGLGLPVLLVIGLYLGMSKNRKIGLGNIMGRSNRGYGAGKSRRGRLGLGKKKGAIRLQEREIMNLPADQQYRDQPERHIPPPPPRNYHERQESLGSLVSEDDRPHGNAFRSEMERQRTGR